MRSFRTLKTKVTKSVRTLTAPGQTVQSLVSLRHTLQAGVYREGSELAGAPASAVASASLSLLVDEARRGGSDDPDRYLAFVDPISGTPLRLILTSIDGHLARVEKGKTHRRDGAREELPEARPAGPRMSDDPARVGSRGGGGLPQRAPPQRRRETSRQSPLARRGAPG